MMRIYIAGPVTGIPERNGAALDAAMRALVDAGELLLEQPVTYDEEWCGEWAPPADEEEQ